MFFAFSFDENTKILSQGFCSYSEGFLPLRQRARNQKEKCYLGQVITKTQTP